MRQEGETMEILEEEGTDDVVPGLAQISCQGWYAPPRPTYFQINILGLAENRHKGLAAPNRSHLL